MRRVLTLVPLALAACSPGGHPPDRFVRATLEYTFTSEPGTKDLRVVLWLPPDLPPAQIVRDEVINPKPVRTFEEGGVRYAEFFFAEPEAETRVRIDLEVELHRRDLIGLVDADLSKVEPLSPEERERYLAVEPGLEHDHERVRRLADPLADVDEDWRLQHGIQIVGDTLRYPGYIPLDQGVLETCRRRSGDCSDYSDLLVCLYRANGIPARRLVGILDDERGSEMHSWVEAWIDGIGWFCIDPLLTDLGEVHNYALMSTYLAFTTERNDPVLGEWQFAKFDCLGGEVDFAWTWTIRSLE